MVMSKCCFGALENSKKNHAQDASPAKHPTGPSRDGRGGIRPDCAVGVSDPAIVAEEWGTVADVCSLQNFLLHHFLQKIPLPSSFLTSNSHQFSGYTLDWKASHPAPTEVASKISSRRRPTSSVARLVSQGSKSEIPTILVLYWYHLVIIMGVCP